jgi:hypothetical protein
MRPPKLPDTKPTNPHQMAPGRPGFSCTDLNTFQAVSPINYHPSSNPESRHQVWTNRGNMSELRLPGVPADEHDDLHMPSYPAHMLKQPGTAGPPQMRRWPMVSDRSFRHLGTTCNHILHLHWFISNSQPGAGQSKLYSILPNPNGWDLREHRTLANRIPDTDIHRN